MLCAENSVKNWRNLPISIPKSDLLNINACYHVCLNIYSAFNIFQKVVCMVLYPEGLNLQTFVRTRCKMIYWNNLPQLSYTLYVPKFPVNNWPAVYLWTYVPSEVSDQPAHSSSLIRIFTGHILDSQRCKVTSCGQWTLHGCAGWSESSLEAHVYWFIFWHCVSMYLSTTTITTASSPPKVGCCSKMIHYWLTFQHCLSRIHVTLSADLWQFHWGVW